MLEQGKEILSLDRGAVARRFTVAEILSAQVALGTDELLSRLLDISGLRSEAILESAK